MCIMNVTNKNPREIEGEAEIHYKRLTTSRNSGKLTFSKKEIKKKLWKLLSGINISA